MNQVHVSVIIPCYNQARFLPEALNSVLSQTFPASEIIVVDDGSTDSTKEVAADYAPRIRYVYQDNGGPAAARNHGLRSARGTHVALLDSDDWWTASFLQETVLALSRARRQAIAYAQQAAVSADAPDRVLHIYNRPLGAQPLRQLVLGPSITADACLIPRELAFEAGLYDESYRGGHEDWDFFLRLASLDTQFILVPKVLAYYRQHADGMHNQSVAMDETRLRVLETWSRKRDRAFRHLCRYAYANAVVSVAIRLVEDKRPTEAISYLTSHVIRHPDWFCNNPFRLVGLTERLYGSSAPISGLRPARGSQATIEQIILELPRGRRALRGELGSVLVQSEMIRLVKNGHYRSSAALLIHVLWHHREYLSCGSVVRFLLDLIERRAC